MIKKTLCILFAVLSLFLFGTGCRKADDDAGGAADDAGQPADGASEKSPEPLTVAVREINKHGNLILNTTFDEMNEREMEIGDLITVFVGDREYVLPIGTSYTDVDGGDMICRFDLEDNDVVLAINLGSFADAAGVAEKQTTEEEPGYKWDVCVSQVGLLLKEKNGYLDEYNARNLTRTDIRSDYPDLTDEEFANFRAVSVSGLKENLLYRSSTPIEPSIGRDVYAMAAMEKAGIRSVINLDDSPEMMRSYDTFPESYYSRCAIINPEMSYDFESVEFAEKVKKSVLFMMENEGPYLIHCKEGKDRTGILCALLECFAGASADEVIQDYMITYCNYYRLQPTDAAYGVILNNNLVKTLCGLFRIEHIGEVDLKEKAARYLISIGLTEEQVNILGEKLVK